MSQPAASNLPWEAGFAPPGLDQNLINTVTGALGTVVSNVENAATSVIPGIIPAPIPIPLPIPSPPVPSPGTPAPIPGVPTPVPASAVDWLQIIERTAQQAVQDAVSGSTDALEKAVAETTQKVIVDELEKRIPAPPPLTLEDFTQADARSRAFRTLFIGLGLSALWGLITALGSLSGIDWFSKEGWVSVITAVVTSVIGSISAYIGRIVKGPAYTAQLAQVLPSSKGP